jgi:hypothetical protein
MLQSVGTLASGQGRAAAKASREVENDGNTDLYGVIGMIFRWWSI